MRTSPSRRGGFTLIEIMVVLVMASIVVAITVTGFTSVTQGNKRTSCQTNLSQIYQSLRLYMSDEGGAPPFDPNIAADADNTGPERGIGLWQLYTFPDPGNADAIAPVGTMPVERYLRSTRALHCPSDNLGTQDQLYNASKTAFNPEYLSYQNFSVVSHTAANAFYSPSRNLPASAANGKRQLADYNGTIYGSVIPATRPPADNTIVTWCDQHRQGAGSGQDNVLFYDGTVQTLRNQGANNWLRLPETN